MKVYLFTLLFLSLIGNSFSQKIKFKQEEVLINNVTVFNFNQKIISAPADIYFLDIELKENLFSQELNNDGTIQITFYKEQVTFETKKGILSKKNFIKDLLKNKVINEKGKISKSNLDFYVKKNEQTALKIR